jgi:hypothetical protein
MDQLEMVHADAQRRRGYAGKTGGIGVRLGGRLRLTAGPWGDLLALLAVAFRYGRYSLPSPSLQGRGRTYGCC